MRGFTLIELIVIILLIGGLLAGGWYYLKPLELKARENDALRLSDLSLLTILVSQSENLASASANTLDDSSDKRSMTGKGWVRVDLSSSRGDVLSSLPIDPLNDQTFHYRYRSDGVGWEIDAVLQSEYFGSKMGSDGGNNEQRFEVGTNLTLLN